MQSKFSALPTVIDCEVLQRGLEDGVVGAHVAVFISDGTRIGQSHIRIWEQELPQVWDLKGKRRFYCELRGIQERGKESRGISGCYEVTCNINDNETDEQLISRLAMTGVNLILSRLHEQECQRRK